VSDIGTRRRKMEQESSERNKPEAKKIRFSSNTPKIGRVFLAGDFYGCMLVVPERFGTHEDITLNQGRSHKYQL
jgi:hypothetical protein